MRLMVTGGGTAGHVYPALAVIEALVSDARFDTRKEDIVWVGSVGGMEERIVLREGIRFQAVSSGALRGKSPATLARNAISTHHGVREARALVKQLRPEAILATGGYVSAPLVLGARGECPVLIYLPDMRPGLAIRYLARYAERIAVSFESVGRSLPARKVLVSGYPVRRALRTADKDSARRSFNLGEDERMLLVLGGSRGSHSINEAVRQSLPELLELAQVHHISGSADYAGLRALGESLPAALARRYHPYAYVDEQMSDLLAAADLVVARAGAATLGEFPAVGLPAILVPYPYAGQHQELNASYLAERGAAQLVHDQDLSAQLLPTVRALIGDGRRLEEMGRAARSLAEPQAAERLAAELQRMARGGGPS